MTTHTIFADQAFVRSVISHDRQTNLTWPAKQVAADLTAGEFLSNAMDMEKGISTVFYLKRQPA